MKTHLSAALRLALVIAVGLSAIGIGAVESPRKIRIMYTGDLMGYLEPCGCGGQNGGGLAKRGTLFTQLRTENPNCVVVDSGNQATMSDRLDLIASVLADLKYDAVGIGSLDLRVGPRFFDAFADARVPVLSAHPNPNPTTRPYLIKEVGGVKVGIVSFGCVTAESGGGELALRTSFYRAFMAARRASDVLILLDQANIASPDWIERNRARLGSPDVVIGGVPQSTLTEPKICGSSYIVQTSRLAKSVGVVDIEFTPGSPLKVSPRLVQLADSTPLDEAIDKRIKQSLNTASGGQPSQAPTIASSNITGGPLPPGGKPYFSSSSCKSCHRKQYEDWNASDHAKAMSHLTTANRLVPECLSCHSESYRRMRDVNAAVSTDSAVECATCHIDSLPHGAERKQVTAKAKVDPALCRTCHTKDWSPKYDEKTYFPRVAHGAATSSATASAVAK